MEGKKTISKLSTTQDSKNSKSFTPNQSLFSAKLNGKENVKEI